LENFMENQNSTDLNTYRGHWYREIFDPRK
jgi:hypothetical protein